MKTAQANTLSHYRPGMNKIAGLVLLLALLMTTSCTSKGFGKQKGKAAGQQAYNNSGELTEYELEADREARFGDGSIPMAEGEGIFRDIFFDYDSSNISEAARTDVKTNAELLKENPNLKVQLEGHCDERGTEEYNLALGEYRAKSVKSALLALGVPEEQIETISYGENLPLEKADTEYALALNRRVHFSAMAKKDNGNRARY